MQYIEPHTAAVVAVADDAVVAATAAVAVVASSRAGFSSPQICGISGILSYGHRTTDTFHDRTGISYFSADPYILDSMSVKMNITKI